MAWPTSAWPTGEPPPAVRLAPLLDAAFDDRGPLAPTYAVLVVHRGRLVAERYAGALAHWDRPSEPVTADTPLLSWSMAKSMLHALVGGCSWPTARWCSTHPWTCRSGARNPELEAWRAAVVAAFA